jgi:quercetin dioxygenase-like cupin family protein
MSRTVTSTAVILALLTGLVLGQLGSFVRQPVAFGPAAPSASPRSLAAARAFSDGIDRLMESGDRAVESTLAPGFIERAQDGQPDRTAPAMIDWLLATRATWPHMRVTVVSLDQHDSTIVACLEIDPGAPQAIPGVHLLEVEPRVVTEFLLVEGAMILDRWSADFGLPVATFTLGTASSWNGPSLSVPAIMHLRLEAGQAMQVPLEGPAIVRVDSGTVQLDRAGNDQNGMPHSAMEPIGAGEVRILDTMTPVMAHNLSLDPGELWVFTMNVDADFQWGTHPTTESENAPLQIAAFIPLLNEDPGGAPRRISITRVTLPPGATVNPHGAGIVEEIAVLDGAIKVTVENGRVLRCHHGDNPDTVDDGAIVASGSGISAKGDTSFGYRVSGEHPATLLVVHIDVRPESDGRIAA